MKWQAAWMKQANRCHGHCFPPEVISTTVWLYHRFSISFRDVEDLLAQRGVTVSYESVRRWRLKFGPMYQRTLKRRESNGTDRWYCDEVFVKINGEHVYLWRVVDEDGDVLDILVQRRRNRVAAERFFRKALERQGRAPRVVVTSCVAYF
ncbi:MAG: IS6 family transposase [Burkholderiaceae bacterium]